METKKYESGHYHTQALFLDNIYYHDDVDGDLYVMPKQRLSVCLYPMASL